MSKGHDAAEETVQSIGTWITAHYGLQFERERAVILQQAVAERMKDRNLSDSNEYLSLLVHDTHELSVLLTLLTVHETYFFRESKQMEVLTSKVVPALLGNRGRKQALRILSAGCSTGEEAYSLAIQLLGMPGCGKAWDFSVTGIDVDAQAISKAKSGIYGQYSFRSCPVSLRRHYFEELPEGYRVREFVRDKVQFFECNLFSPVYPGFMQAIDVLFFRNVSIYFSEKHQQHVLNKLIGLLNAGGYLFMSSAEMLAHQHEKLDLVKSGKVYYFRRKSEDTRKKSNLGDVHTPRKIVLKEECREKTAGYLEGDWALVLTLVKNEEYEQALAILDEWIAKEGHLASLYSLQANIFFHKGHNTVAQEKCRRALVLEPLCLEAYMIMGLIEKTEGRYDKAIPYFQRAITIDENCWLGHYYLAESYRMLNIRENACREYRITEQLLDAGGYGRHGLSYFSVPFQADHFIILCRHHTGALSVER